MEINSRKVVLAVGRIDGQRKFAIFFVTAAGLVVPVCLN